MPIDVVRPWAPNEHILITTGTPLVYRCEGQQETRYTVTTGVYRVTLQSPGVLYGDNWYLVATFQRDLNLSLHHTASNFTLDPTFPNLLTNLSDFQPLVTKLESLDPVARKQFRLQDIQTLTEQTTLPDSSKFWHSFWTVPVLAIVSGFIIGLWRRFRQLPTSPATQGPEMELTPVTPAESLARAGPAPFTFSVGSPPTSQLD